MVTKVTWSTALPLTGLSAADITEEDEASILSAIAATSDDTDEDDLEITSITDVARRLAVGLTVDYFVGRTAHATAHEHEHEHEHEHGAGDGDGVASDRRGRELSSGTVEVEYTTTLILEDTSFTDVSELFSSVTTDISTSVSSGVLEANIQAEASSSSALKSVAVDVDSFVAPTTYETTTVPLNDQDDNSGNGGSSSSSTSYFFLVWAIGGALMVGGFVYIVFLVKLSKKRGARELGGHEQGQGQPQQHIPVATAEYVGHQEMSELRRPTGHPAGTQLATANVVEVTDLGSGGGGGGGTPVAHPSLMQREPSFMDWISSETGGGAEVTVFSAPAQGNSGQPQEQWASI